MGKGQLYVLFPDHGAYDRYAGSVKEPTDHVCNVSDMIYLPHGDCYHIIDQMSIE